jgi:transcriptional regulator with XRE-family HTH domain
MSVDLKDVGAVLKARREELEWSIGKVAQKAGLTTSTIYKLERKTRCSLENFIFVCEALDLHPGTVLFRAARLDQKAPNC